MERNECYIICTLTRVWFTSFTNGGINRDTACPVSKDKLCKRKKNKQTHDYLIKLHWFNWIRFTFF